MIYSLLISISLMHLFGIPGLNGEGIVLIVLHTLHAHSVIAICAERIYIVHRLVRGSIVFDVFSALSIGLFISFRLIWL